MIERAGKAKTMISSKAAKVAFVAPRSATNATLAALLLIMVFAFPARSIT